MKLSLSCLFLAVTPDIHAHYNVQKTWLEAKADCENEGRKLVSIHSSSINTEISNLIPINGVDSWIGLTDRSSKNGEKKATFLL